MEAVRVCLVGSGRVGHLYSSIYQKYITEAKIAAVVDEDILRTREVASECNIPDENVFDNFEQAIEKVKIDAALITTPTFTHAKLTVLAAESGLHVFCEKPMAVDLQDCDLMIRACKKAGVLFQIGFMRRFDESYMYAHRKVSEGAIGRPILIRSYSQDPEKFIDGAIAFAGHSGGQFLDMAVHDIDLARWFTGSEPETVYAIGSCYAHPEFGEYNDGDNVSCLMKFKDDTMVFL